MDRVQAIMFDLDNTLLRNDGDQFLEEFSSELARYLDPKVPYQRFMEAIMAAGAAMIADQHPDRTNEEVLITTLADLVAVDRDWLFQRYRAFVQGDLGRIGLPWGRIHASRPTVEWALASGYKIVVATSPIYPPGPIMERLRRADLDLEPWDLITTADQMHSVKPHASYYLEAARLIGVDPRRCVMVGDDLYQDMSAARAGFSCYLVSEQPMPTWQGARGSLNELPQFVRSLS